MPLKERRYTRREFVEHCAKVAGLIGVGAGLGLAQAPQLSPNSGSSATHGRPPETDPSLGLPPTLLKEYWQVNVTDGYDHPETVGMRYLPGQFAAGVTLFDDGSFPVSQAGEYQGWDFLRTREHRSASVSYGKRDFVRLQLNRATLVAIIWQGSPANLPSWLQSWARGGDVTVQGDARATFKRVLSAGEHWLGTNEGRDVQMYTVLFAEADGSPWRRPADPLGRDVPPPNTTVSREHWLHKRHFALGPDNQLYPTWHEQIDPVWWIYYGHDHGSDPKNFAAYEGGWRVGTQGVPLTRNVRPLWTYSNPNEALTFFKVFTFDAINPYDGRAYSFMFNAHLGSSDYERVCERFHTMDLAIADRETKEVVAELYSVADFGFSRVWDSQNRSYRVRPADCPENYTLENTDGRRNIPLADNFGYESWQPQLGEALPVVGQTIPVTDDPIALCSTEQSAGVYTCNEVETQTDRSGSFRWFNTFDTMTTGFGIDTTTGSWGEFYTDRYGHKRLNKQPDALRQYAKPGVRVVHHTLGKWFVLNSWKADYVNALEEIGKDVVLRFNRNLEHAIVNPN